MTLRRRGGGGIRDLNGDERGLSVITARRRLAVSSLGRVGIQWRVNLRAQIYARRFDTH